MSADTPAAELEAMRMEAHTWRTRLDDERASDADHAAFETWLARDPRHLDEYERIDTLWSRLGGLDTADLDPAHRATLAPAETPVSADKGARWRDQPWFARVVAGAATSAIAASILFAIVPMPALIDTASDPTVQAFASAHGEIEEVRLADGSVLTLGADSAVEVAIGPDSRAVVLTRGEAYFDVASDVARPFRVNAGALKVEVTGTEFDIRLGRTTVGVGVAEGAVSVTYPAMAKGEAQDRYYRHILREGSAINVDQTRGFGEVSRLRTDAVAAWRGGRLTYAGTPLIDVVADANRYSDMPIRIVGDQARRIRVSGSFDAAEIDDTLDTLAEILPIRVDRSAAEVIRITSAPD